MKMGRLFLIGLNHKTAPVEIRERLALPPSRLGHALDYVKDVPGIHEAAIISTCNRVEIYAWGEEGAAEPLRRSLLEYHSGGRPGSLEGHLYTRRHEEAAGHLFRVASGLDSLVVGEAEILGQVKAAVAGARAHGAAGVHLDELFRRAIACGKRSRSETAISRGALSIGAAAVELARQIFGSLTGQTILILGAGKMSGRVASCLVSSGAHRVLVANRTLDHAQELANTFSDEGAPAEAVSWEEFPQRLAQADIVIASTRAPHHIVTSAQVAAAMKGRRRSLLLIDIAVPRDIDPEVNKLDDVFLFDIDDMEQVVEQNRTQRAGEVVRVESIIDEEIQSWQSWREASQAQPVMAALARHAAGVRDAEVEATLKRLEHLSPRDREIIEAMGRSIASKLVHPPLAHLRNGGVADAPALNRAFGLISEEGGKERLS
jgi:glutamyl-tRNA reductase